MTRKQITEKDQAFRKQILERDSYTCQYCGSKEKLTIAHIFSRLYLKHRWNPDNALILCVNDHLFTLQRRKPYDFIMLCIKKFGKRKLDAISRDINKTKKNQVSL